MGGLDMIRYFAVLVIIINCSSCGRQFGLNDSIDSSQLSPGEAIILASSTTPFDFGSKEIPSSTLSTVTITNSGQTKATDINFAIDSGPFTISSDTCTSISRELSSGNSCTVTLNFNAQEIASTTKKFTISYKSNGENKQQTYNVTGNAGNSATLFALMDAGDGPTQFDSYLSKQQVDGIAVRVSWDNIQPSSESSYSWTKIDQAFSSAAANNKLVTLHILTSVYGNTPTWVYTAGAVSYTYNKPTGGTKTDPLPWDSIYLAKWSAFLTALKNHLDAQNYTSKLAYISVGSPVPEMSLVGCVSNDLNGSYAGTVTSLTRG